MKTETENGDGHPTYRIEHVRDFLQVPDDRLSQCLEEFADYLAIAKSMNTLASAIGEIVGAEGAVEIGAFTWIDDGERKRTLTFQEKPITPRPS